MTKEFEDRGNTYTIHESKDIGEVRVADEVVAIIAGLAARGGTYGYQRRTSYTMPDQTECFVRATQGSFVGY